MKAWELIGETLTPEGSVMRLTRHDDEYVILVDGRTLMSSRMHGSEDALAVLAWRHLRHAERPRVLVGGLGTGFTLRAALDILPADAVVTVSELVPAVVEWNRGPLSHLAGHPLSDARVRVEVGNVGFTVRGNTDRFDAILLDVDNGPAAFTTLDNCGLYDRPGIAASHSALRTGGTLAVWSAWEDEEFVQRLRAQGFEVTAERVRGRVKKRGPHHTIFLARKI